MDRLSRANHAYGSNFTFETVQNKTNQKTRPRPSSLEVYFLLSMKRTEQKCLVDGPFQNCLALITFPSKKHCDRLWKNRPIHKKSFHRPFMRSNGAPKDSLIGLPNSKWAHFPNPYGRSRTENFPNQRKNLDQRIRHPESYLLLVALDLPCHRRSWRPGEEVLHLKS